MPSLRTIELDWAGETPPEDQPQFEISDFFAWMFGIGAFDCAVIAAQQRRFHLMNPFASSQPSRTRMRSAGRSKNWRSQGLKWLWR